MPWREVSVVDQREEFIRLAQQEGVNRRELCRRFGVSSKTGYKWLSRRPHETPGRSGVGIEAAVLAAIHPGRAGPDLGSGCSSSVSMFGIPGLTIRRVAVRTSASIAP